MRPMSEVELVELETALRARPGDVNLKDCPSRRVLDLIADKWSVLVLVAVGSGVTRNGALLRTIEGVSQKMLTQTLRSLERNGLVDRAVQQVVPPRVDYTLTPPGASLLPLVRDMCRWARERMVDVELARAQAEGRTSG